MERRSGCFCAACASCCLLWLACFHPGRAAIGTVCTVCPLPAICFVPVISLWLSVFHFFVSAQHSVEGLTLSRLVRRSKRRFRIDQRQGWSRCDVCLRHPGAEHSWVTAHVCRLMPTEKPSETRTWEDLHAASFVETVDTVQSMCGHIEKWLL